MDLPTDMLTGRSLDQAFAGNRLLATLDGNERALLEPHMSVVEFSAGETILGAGDGVERSIFPFDGLLVSMLVEASPARSIEVASIGKEGAVGGIISCGTAPIFSHVIAQIAGPAVAMPLHALELAKQASPHLRNLFCRYSDALLAQVMQSVACNACHPIEARAARWLLHAQDRVGGDRLALTQENLAEMLGVQRTTVNAVARVFQEQGLISYRRGAIQVADRGKLSKVACGCYQAVEHHFASVLGTDGRGGAGYDCD